MLEFKRLDKNVKLIKDYLLGADARFCDLSLGVKYMWRDDFICEYAFYNKTLIIKESTPDYNDAFYFPIGDDVAGGIEQIENYAKTKNIPLKFCCLDNAQAGALCQRYFCVRVFNDRDWSDYIYDAEKFKTYSGKKLSGQRNHVNKFKKLYPQYKFKAIEKSDFVRIKEFLDEFNSRAEFLRWSEAVEQQKVFDLVENMFELDQVGGLIEVDGKVVAFSIGERIKDTLIVHIEKALTSHAGVYPTMAQEFAKAFANNGIKFINREEDCGDVGLRISKLQYQPLEVKEKNFVQVSTLFDKICSPVLIKTQRLTVTEINQNDKDDYQRIYLDQELNKWWGYDYKEDLLDNEPTADYFFGFQNALKQKKEEFSFAVRLDGKMIGELVLHNFDYFGGVEMGFRFFKEYHGNGYAIESALALKEYAVFVMGAKKIKSRCVKENVRSKNLIEKLGLIQKTQDQTHFYFELKV